MKQRRHGHLRHPRRADRPLRRRADARRRCGCASCSQASTCRSWSRCRATTSSPRPSICSTASSAAPTIGQTWIEALPPRRPQGPRHASRARRRQRVADHHHLQRSRRRLGRSTSDGAPLYPLDARRPAPARNGAARRHQSRDVHADRQLQGRSGACARSAGKAVALNDMVADAVAPALAAAGLRGAARWPRSPSSRSPLWTRPRAALRCARSVAALLLFALADPSLVREDRRPLKDVVAVVVDRCGSQPHRRARARRPRGARRQSSRQLAALGQCRGAFRRSPARGSRQRGHASCSRRCATRSPTCRPSGSAARSSSPTEIVHDIPANADDARLPRAAACVHHRPRGRARPAHRTRRGAALRHRRQGPDHRRARARQRRSRRARDR